MNRNGHEDLEGASSLSFPPPGEDFFEVFEFFVVRYCCPWLK
jgi:hypothetical protein